MEKTIKKLHQAFHIAAVSVVAIAFTVVVVQAATTIGSNITTGGTISAYSGLVASNNASSTQLTATTTLFVGADANGLVISDGSILDGSGAISFGDENLTTTGNIAFATASSTGAVKFPTISSDTGSISFSDENLTTTGNIAMATASSTGLVKLNTAQISGTGDTISDIQFGTCAVVFGAVTASTTAVANCTATGVTTSHRVFVTPRLTDQGFVLQSASSTANDTIQVAVFNSGWYGNVNPADYTWEWFAIK
jgi:hypothetical protein